MTSHTLVPWLCAGSLLLASGAMAQTPPEGETSEAPTSESPTAESPTAEAPSEPPKGEGAEAPAAEAPAAGRPAEAPSSDEAPSGEDGSNPLKAAAERIEEAPTPAPVAAEAEAEQPPARDPSLPPDLLEIVEELAEFERETQAYRRDVSRMVLFQYERRRAGIQAQYSAVVEQLVEEERRRRQDAISRFEEFLAKYPSHKTHTPNAIFRLAELHFEKSNDEYITSLEQYDEQMNAFDAGTLKVEPAEPKQNYQRTIALFERLIRSWPGYSNIDGAYYLKGYCLLEMGEDRQALDQFLALVEKMPESQFVPESYMRIGEYYFDYNQLDKAIAAYSRVLEFEDSAYYDKGLYKLAWTYYRDDQYEKAISRFKELVEYSDDKVKRTGKGGSELRSEAILYLAISLQEEDWDGDGEPDADGGFDRALRYLSGEKPYEVEVLKELARIYFDNAKYQESIAAIRFLLDRFPENPDNPELHNQMILAYERLQEFDKAFAERDVLADKYGEGSEWYAANATSGKAIEAAEQLAEQALIQAATYHHTRAQDLKSAAGDDPGAAGPYIDEYAQAATAYEKYLARYPKSDNTYELSYYYAECLYFSFRYPEAAVQYATVRDSKLGEQYREDSATSAILSWQNAIREGISKGEIEPKPSLLPPEERTAEVIPPPADDQEGVITIEPEVMPELVDKLQTDREIYVKSEIKNEDPALKARVAFDLGDTYFDYKQYDKARAWFSWLIENHPQAEVTTIAANNIIQSYRAANDWQKMAEWSEIIANANIGSEGDREALRGEIKRLKVGALFKQAEQLFNEGKFEKAAEEYIRLVDENPKNKYADRALNNAAVAFEKTRRFESATNTYQRIYQDYPDSEFAENALYRVAVNAERFYDFDRAIETNLALVNKYEDSQYRADALYQAALLQEQNQSYAAAAENFQRYARLFPERDDTAKTYYQAALNYKKLGDTRNEMQIYESFIQKYGQNPKNNGLVIECLAKIADTYADSRNQRKARKAYQRVINEFNARAMPAGTLESQYPAKAAFLLAEMDFGEYQALKLSGSLKNQGRVIKKMQTGIKDLERKYADVTQFKSLEWTIAAFYRLGHIYQLFAEDLYEAPIPSSFSFEEEDLYRTELENIALPIEDKAVERYELAYEKAREFKVNSEWTQRILESLNKYKPSEYPVFKRAEPMLASDPQVAPQLLTPPPPPEEEEIPPPSGPEEAPEAEDAPAVPVASPEGVQ